MSGYSNLVFLVLLLFFHSSQLCFFTNSTSTCYEQERQALLKFRSSFSNTSFEPLGSWEGLDCCQWKGVGCEIISGHVIKLNLSPPCPTSYRCLEAKGVNPSLLELEHLDYLDLSGISFGSNSIPKFLGSMKQLCYLNLSYTDVSGRIPHHLGNLSNLRVLDLSHNWELHDDDVGWVSKLSSLKHMAMNDVSLKKAHNLFQVLSTLPSLLQAQFHRCGITNIHFTCALINSTFFPNVELLDLSSNGLHGPIPNAFRNMTSIRALDLFDNSLSLVPHWLAHLHSLIHLDLSVNLFNEIEASIVSILNCTCSLQFIDLSDINILGYAGVDTLSFGGGNLSGCEGYDLEELLISESGIRDTLPSWIGELKNLKSLDLSNNFLYGSLPISLGRLSNLVELDLSDNNLTGTIANILGQLVNLNTFRVSNNHFEGIFSKIHLEKLSNLQSLQIGYNKLHVNIDSNWTPPFLSLVDLGMASCNIDLEYPQWLLKQERLVSLDLSYNKIRGTIPENIGDRNPYLSILVLKSNLIEGSIPNSLCKIDITILDLSYNRFSGQIPNCWRDTEEIHIIDLSSNKLSGTIPSSFKNFSGVFWLNLSNNKLHGELRQVLKNMPNPIVLDLSENQFTGVIPPWIGIWHNLAILRLSQNLLSGDIPSSLCQLSSLQILDLASSNLSGSIPSCICKLSGMILEEYSNISSYLRILLDGPATLWHKTGSGQVLKGLQQNYTSNLRYLTNIDLSNNSMNGSIPEGLTCLSRLNGLNLSHNKFSGMIPRKIENVKSLESIDLSSNQLFGPIPTNMSTLTSLSYLNLSNNNFSGLIPREAQFSTFGPSSYSGNPYLCGDPLNNACPQIGIAQPPTSPDVHDDNDDDEDGKEKVLFYFVIAVGFIIGFWGVIGLLMVKTNWRYACFRQVDNFVDFMYVEIGIRKAKLKNKSKRNEIDR